MATARGCGRVVAASMLLGASLTILALSLAALVLAQTRYQAAYREATAVLHSIPRLDPGLLREAAAAYTRLARTAPELRAAAGLYTRLYPELRKTAQAIPVLLNLTETPEYHELVDLLRGLSALSPEAAKAARLLEQLPGALRSAAEAARLVEEMPPGTLNQTLQALQDLLEKLPPGKLNQTIESLLEAQQRLQQLNQTLAQWPPERVEAILKAILAASAAAAGVLAALTETWLRELCSGEGGPPRPGSGAASSVQGE